MIIKKKVSKQKEEAKLAEVAAEEAAKIAEEDAKQKEAEQARKKKEEELDIFDVDNIDFTQRKERRTGNRRRGYRRIDDRNLVSRAQEEAIEIKQGAYQEGYNAGVQKAQADLANLRNTLGVFMGAEDKVFNEVAPKILDIALDIAQKIIKTQVQIDTQILLNTVLDVLKTLSRNEPKITIKVNPVQVQFLKDTLPEQLNLMGMDTTLNVLPDESIMEGGCIVQTNNGMVDARIEAQIEIVQNALRSME